MKLPRLTIHRMMIRVALAGITFGAKVWMDRRSAEFRDLMLMHHASWRHADWNHEYNGPTDQPSPWSRYHLEMAKKYQRAARYPWIPVGRRRALTKTYLDHTEMGSNG
jgi:hypothetical protein